MLYSSMNLTDSRSREVCSLNFLSKVYCPVVGKILPVICKGAAAQEVCPGLLILFFAHACVPGLMALLGPLGKGTAGYFPGAAAPRSEQGQSSGSHQGRTGGCQWPCAAPRLRWQSNLETASACPSCHQNLYGLSQR